jgi:tetratricopeptide (TPR) repeat protein
VTGLRRRGRSPPTDRSQLTPDEPKPNLLALTEEWVRLRFGFRGIVFLAALFALGFVWWNWEEVKTKQGMRRSSIGLKSARCRRPHRKSSLSVSRTSTMTRTRTRSASSSKAIEEFPGVQVLRFDRRIALDQDSRDEALRQAYENARSLLSGSGADVLIWGTVLKTDGKSLPKLHWTTAAEVSLQGYSGRYVPTEDLNLPPLFWDDLVEVLRLVVARYGAEFLASRGQFIADRLKPFVERVRTLLAHARWSPGAWADVSETLGVALVLFGQEALDKQALGEAVGIFRAVLEVRPRDQLLDWAMTQNNLGNALLLLGQLETGTDQLQEAMGAFRAALEELTRKRAPLEWAATKSNLARISHQG